jgi:uncharacterized membrane protein
MSGGVVTTAPHRRLTGRRLEVVYRIGVVIKGIDGVFELFVGILLWIAPGTAQVVLRPLSVHLEQGNHPLRNYAGHIAGHLDHQHATGPALTIVVVFLLAHGIVKIALVYCLLREFIWVYPYALIILGLFTVYQAYVLVRHPSVAIVLFLVLDLIIMWLVWREWRQLRSKSASGEDSGVIAA